MILYQAIYIRTHLCDLFTFDKIPALCSSHTLFAWHATLAQAKKSLIAEGVLYNIIIQLPDAGNSTIHHLRTCQWAVGSNDHNGAYRSSDGLHQTKNNVVVLIFP